MPSIYLDHSATQLPDSDTIRFFSEELVAYSANPASLHPAGHLAAQRIEAARKQLAAALGCQPNEIILTSGGSESINTALKGYVQHNPKRGKTILAASGEHPATTATLAWLKQQGYTIRLIPLLPDGQLNLEQLKLAINDDTCLITCMLVHNETGAVRNIGELVSLRNRIRPLTAIHLDAVQAAGKMWLNFKQLGVELLSVSGHKFGAPKGIGLLLVRKGVLIEPLIHGGGQQQGRRAGTENAPLVSTLAFALDRSLCQLDEKTSTCSGLRQLLFDELDRHQVSYSVLSPAGSVPQIVNLSFPGLRGETLLHALERSEIAVSSGSACSSHKPGPSDALLAMGFRRELVDCSIRVSLAVSNTPEEIIQTAAAMAEACRLYRRQERP